MALLRGSRQRQREARQRARAEQAERVRWTGFAGSAPELGHAVALELRQRGYSAALAAFGGHLCAVGGNWNFQGNPRLAELIGRSVRSAQRYRAQLEADGLLRSYLLEPGDMIDGQRAPVLRPQVVRDVSILRGLVAERMAKRPLKSPLKRRSKAERRAAARAAALVAPPAPSPPPAPLSAEQLQAVAASAPEWLRGAILQGRGAVAAPRKGRTDDRAPVRELTDAELDAIDAELRELTEQLRQREQQRERAPPD